MRVEADLVLGSALSVEDAMAGTLRSKALYASATLTLKGLEMTIHKTLPSDLLDEYRFCNERASSLGDLVWKTATLLGVGSIAAIIALASLDSIPAPVAPWFTTIIALLAIGFLAAWKRMAGRWLSIEYALLRRMEHIERSSQLRATLYTARLDGRGAFVTAANLSSVKSPFLDPDLDADLATIANHQREGIRAAVVLIAELNIAAWLAFAVFSISPVIAHALVRQPSLGVVLVATIAFAAFFVWRLIHMGRQF